MLTKNNVIQLYNDGLVIRWRRKKHPHHLKGEYDPVGFEVNIYTAHLLSEHDRDMTLLHELIHARDDHKGLPNNRTCSPRVEREAEATYQRRPGVVPRLVLEKSPLQKQITGLDISPELAPFSLGICTVKKNLRNPKILAFWEIAAL